MTLELKSVICCYHQVNTATIQKVSQDGTIITDSIMPVLNYRIIFISLPCNATNHTFKKK